MTASQSLMSSRRQFRSQYRRRGPTEERYRSRTGGTDGHAVCGWLDGTPS
jgi:hypothetical protein